MKNFDYITYSKSKTAKYVNGYLFKDDFYELHITDLESKSHILKIDQEDFAKINQYFWCINYIGRVGSKKPVVYTYINRAKQNLNSLLVRKKAGEQILFVNRDVFDFRKENLIASSKHGTQKRICSKKNKELENGIFIRKQKDGTITGYGTMVSVEGKRVFKYFGIREYKNLEMCLNMAKKARDEDLKNSMK